MHSFGNSVVKPKSLIATDTSSATETWYQAHNLDCEIEKRTPGLPPFFVCLLKKQPTKKLDTGY